MKITLPRIPKIIQSVKDPAALFAQDVTVQGAYFDSNDMKDISVHHLNVHESRFNKVNLANAVLENLDLLDVEIIGSELTALESDEASWQSVSVSGCRASGLSLTNGVFENVIFENCRLDLANFRYSKFKNVIFRDCYMSGADFYQSTMLRVSFENCVLTNVEISQATLKSVDLRSSDIAELKSVKSLVGATISSMQLMQIAPALAHNLQIIVEDS